MQNLKQVASSVIRVRLFALWIHRIPHHSGIPNALKNQQLSFRRSAKSNFRHQYRLRTFPRQENELHRSLLHNSRMMRAKVLAMVVEDLTTSAVCTQSVLVPAIHVLRLVIILDFLWIEVILDEVLLHVLTELACWTSANDDWMADAVES